MSGYEQPLAWACLTVVTAAAVLAVGGNWQRVRDHHRSARSSSADRLREAVDRCHRETAEALRELMLYLTRVEFVNGVELVPLEYADTDQLLREYEL